MPWSAQWQDQSISVGTLKNRLSALRWWAKKVNKPSIIAKDNGVYGIGKREYVANESKAQALDDKKLSGIADPFVSPEHSPASSFWAET